MNGIDKKILITAVMAIALAAVLVFDYSDESVADPSGNILDSGSNVIGTYTLNGYTLTLTATSVSDETSITLSGITAGERATVQKLVITGFTSDITHSFDDYTAINSIEFSGKVSTGGDWTFNYLDGEIALVPSGDNSATAIVLNDFKMQSLVTSVLIRGYSNDLSESFSTYPALQNNITYKGSFTGTYGGIWEYQLKTKTLIADRNSGSSVSSPGTYSQDDAPFKNMFFKDEVQNVEYRTFTGNSQNLFYGLTSVKTFRGTHFNESNNYSILYGMESTLEELRYDRVSSVQGNTISVVKETLKVFTADSARDVSARTFSGATNLATINLPEAKTVGEFAFTNCSSLQLVNLNSVESLGRYAFNNCSALRDISLPSATSLGTFAFTGCSSLRSVTLSSEAAIGDSCFINANSLTTVVFNKQVTLGEAAFSGCSNLVSITSSKIASIGLDAFNGCAKMTGEGGVFDLTALKTINSSSAKYPFRGCVAITTIMMPAVTTMGPYAFNGCTNLATVTIGNNLGEISNYAFSNCAKLSDVTIGNDLVIVGDHAFDGCSALDSLEIPDSTETIGDSAFANSGILAFDTKNVLTIGTDAFRNSAISTLDLGDMIQTIGDNAFRASSISGDLVFPASITSIGTYAFAQISVSTITFTDGGTTVDIGNSAFRDCSALTTVNLGNCVKSLGTEAFCNCTAMSAMSFGTGMESIGDRAFSGCNTMSAEVTIPKNTTYIGVDSFKGTNIRSLTFAEDSILETISAGAFQDCRALRRVIEIPDSVIEIGQNAFNNSVIKGLTFDVTESKLTTIGASAFVNCASLTDRVDLPLNVQTIGNDAFSGCNIKELGLGPKLATLGLRAFQNNSNLTEVVIPNTVTPLTIPANTFNGCGLTDIYLSSSVASIAANAFNCAGVSASQANIWFNGPLSGITIADGAFRFNNTVTAVVYTDPSSDSVDLKNKISSVSKITYERRMSGNISFSTTEGTLLYNQITAIYGSKIILPYYALGSGGYGSLYYAVRDNSETNQYLSVFASEADFNAHSESNNRVARSGYVVPVYPLSDKDSIRMYGFTVTDSFVDTMTITTESSGLAVDIVSQTSHYGGIIRIPSFVQSDLIIKNAVTIKSADGLKAYTLAVDTVSVYAGINYSQITLGYEDVYIDVTFIGWDEVEHVASVKLRSSFAIPVELQYLEENPDGYRFNGWWDAPGTSGVRADELTKFDFNDKWYVNFQPLTYTLELKTKSSDPSEPTHESTWTLYGPYSLHVVGNSLYYTDAVNTNKVMMFEGNSILGWTVSNYQDNRGRNYTGDTEPMIGDRIGDNAVFIRLTMNLYDLTLEFYNAGVAIDAAQVFKIRGWEVGDGEDFHFGSTVEDVPYSKIQNGLNLPVPVNQTYAFNNMVAGSTPVPKADDGHYYLRITYFESSDSITIRYNMDIGVYTVEFTMNDDASSVFVDGPFNVGDEVWLNSADYYTKIGYQFHHYSIAGDATEYRDGRNVVITDAMVGSSSYCVISVTAVWTPLDYSVTFDLGDYTAEIPAQTVNNGGTVTLPDVSKYYGHTPESWFWVKGEAKSETFTENPTLTSDIITAYADGLNIVIGVNWALKTYTLNVRGDTSYAEITDAKLGDTVTLWTHTYVPQYKAFSGWGIGESTYKEGDVTFDSVMAEAGDANSGVVSFTMVYIDIQYHIRYDPQGGVGSIEDLNLYVIGDEFHVAVPDSSVFYKYGYSFVGWKFNKDDDVIYEDTGTFKEELARNADTSTSTVTFYAVWAQKSYRISYELEGGRYGPSAPSYVRYGDDVPIDNPTRVGYTFEGWTATGLGTGALYKSKSDNMMHWNGTLVEATVFRDLTESSSPVILTAHWAVASYNTQYLPNGGTWTSISSSQYQIRIGDTIELPTVRDATKTGYSFAGWGIDTANVIPAGTKLTEAMVGDSSTFTLYAIWTPVIYQLQYRYITDSQYSTINVDYGTSAYVPILERAGYTFRGWTINGAGMEAEYSTDKTEWYKIGSSMVNGTYFRNMSTEAGAVITMNAEWTPIEYRVAYNCNGGTGIAPTDSNVYTVGTKLEMKEYSYLNGTNGSKTIIGWSLEINGSAVNVSEFTQGLCNAADATNTVNFYGVWISDMCTVIVDLEGGSPNFIPAGWIQNAEGKYEKMVNPNTNTKDALEDWSTVTISKGGYSFSGWEYNDSIVLSTVTAYPVFDKIQTTALYGFLAIIAAFPIIAVVIFVLNRPR